ncbi:unnamed protein product [Ixodes persulcatus]
MAESPKLRVLCLHGYRQDGQSFKSKLGGFRKATKSVLDPVFIDAPHLIPESSNAEGNIAEPNVPGGRGWWFSSSQKSFNAQEHTDVCVGFDDSVKAVEKACSLGPFDGILGFSQGAAMAALVLCLQSLGKLTTNLKFGVLIAGFKSRSTLHDVLYTDGLVKVPTLHIVGDTDAVIPKPQAMEIVPFFKSPQVVCHPGGHFIPTGGSCKTDYLAFLREMLQVCGQRQFMENNEKPLE